MDNKKQSGPLDAVIGLVQIEQFGNKFQSAMSKEIKIGVIKSLIYLGTVGLGVTINVIVPSPITICATAVLYTTVYTLDRVHENKRIRKAAERNEPNVDQILKEGIDETSGEDFYTEKAKKILNYKETEDERKYREALEKQRAKYKENPNYKELYLSAYERNNGILNKEDAMIQLIREINLYIVLYNIPPVTITNSEWNILIDEVYKILSEMGKEAEFYERMSFYCRMLFAKALVNNVPELNLQYFVENLSYLNSGLKISKKRFKKLQTEINSSDKKLNIHDLIVFNNQPESKNGLSKEGPKIIKISDIKKAIKK